jgi:dihydrofolate synthase/folylpolyglutamate synthase
MNIWRVPYPKFGDGPGLERVSAIAERLGVDLEALGRRSAVVVGSNGKGSTAAMCAALLQQADANVGLFTSPHLFALNERFRTDEDDISDEELKLHWDRVVAAIDAGGHADKVGGFEFLFLLAADWFAARDCWRIVWEAGLGGRLDPVRLLKASQVALTSLDLEHTALLGDTLEAIALEKIAAAPDRARLFASGTISADVRRVIARYCGEHDMRVEYVEPLAVAPLPGAHQLGNAALALSLAREMTPLSDAQVATGFAATRWSGRLEKLSEEPLVVIDVGHTSDGVTAALGGFAEMRGQRRAVLICGVSQDKDAASIISRLAPAFDVIVCAAAQHKGAPPALIAVHAQTANPDADITIAESVADARGLALAKAQGGAVYVAGGLFLAVEYKAVHLGRDPASLAFF